MGEREKPAVTLRALSRGLKVIEALNRYGAATALQLSRETGVPRVTTYRILQTLMADGYVMRSPSNDRFRLRMRVRNLSDGFEDEEWVSGITAPVLFDLTRRVLWPCDLATLEGTRMVIRESTHRRAPLSIDRNMVGTSIPLLGGATGQAYLAFAPKAEQRLLLKLLVESGDPCDALARRPAEVEQLLSTVRQRGYGLRQGGPHWPHTGSVAVPLRHNGRVLGCIAAIWMARVFSAEQGVATCLGPLREAAEQIEAGLRNMLRQDPADGSRDGGGPRPKPGRAPVVT